MKLPGSVIIAGQEWKIKTNKASGGSFRCDNGVITIGTEYPADVAETFLHEVLEALLTMRGCRYRAPEDVDYLFNFTHREFNNLMYDLALALKDVLKNK